MRLGIQIAAVLLAAPLTAQAQSFRCVGPGGSTYYGSVIPPQCVGRPVEQLSPQGMVIRRIDPEGAEKERVAKQAAEAKRREEEAAAKEAARRNRALLATYTSERDIEDARARALEENQKALRQIEERIETALKRQSGYQKEMEFYQGKNPPPQRLAEDINNARQELEAQQRSLEAKRKEVLGINAKYDEDRKRYVELTRRR